MMDTEFRLLLAETEQVAAGIGGMQYCAAPSECYSGGASVFVQILNTAFPLMGRVPIKFKKLQEAATARRNAEKTISTAKRA